MNYPFWDVPHLGSGWVIGMIAIFHVLVSHFAIGGGFYLPMAERKALKENRPDWMVYIKKHSKFFLILTGAYGTVTGVGIWFAIGLANPEATSTLIHNFVFGWAIEWTFFIIEVTAAVAYYYTWGRVSDKLHLTIGWIYAISAWLSLVIINGILTFMLTPGEGWLSVAGTGTEASKFWHAFFNPTYFPSACLRTVICISLAGIWALLTASRIDGRKQPKLKTEVIRWSASWLLPAFVLLPVFFLWYLYAIPAEARGLLQLGMTTIGQGVFTQVTRASLVTVMTSATILAIVYFMAYRNPRDFGFGHAFAVLILALAATASTEHTREMLRKPYVIGQHMFSNGVRTTEVASFTKNGYLTKSPWASAEDHVKWAAIDAKLTQALIPVQPAAQGAPAPVPPSTRSLLTAEEWISQLDRGKLIFQGQCLACHTRDAYRPMLRLLADRDRTAIGNILQMLHEYKTDSPYRKFMPPLVGTADEVKALGDYLDSLVNVPKPPVATNVAAAPAP